MVTCMTDFYPLTTVGVPFGLKPEGTPFSKLIEKGDFFFLDATQTDLREADERQLDCLFFGSLESSSDLPESIMYML